MLTDERIPPLRARGFSRDDGPLGVDGMHGFTIYFNRDPTNDEMRDLHDLLRKHSASEVFALLAESPAVQLQAVCPHCVGRTGMVCATCEDCMGSGVIREADQPNALDDVTAERFRQVAAEGWMLAHDDRHDTGELARAAACYALHAGGCSAWDAGSYQTAEPHHGDPEVQDTLWPWDRAWWKPKNPRRDLVRAAALIIAEIERIDREAARRLRSPQEEVNCTCRQCTRARDAAAPHVAFFTEERSRMIVCETCGNKRCPHANDHRNTCTGSNEPGQPGSAYP